NVPFGVTYEKIGTIQRRLAWPLHKDDTLSRSGRPKGLNIYLCHSLGLSLRERLNKPIKGMQVKSARAPRPNPGGGFQFPLLVLHHQKRRCINIHSKSYSELHLKNISCNVPVPSSPAAIRF
ncbi:hypothetical protein BDN71DRAFT_1384486, partial [Pleurotus eryngii]